MFETSARATRTPFVHSLTWVVLAGMAVAAGCSAPADEPGASGSSGSGSSGTTSGTGGSAGSSTGTGGSVGGSTTTGTGGTTGGGGTVGSGGTSVGPCERPVGACTAPTVNVTEIDMGVEIVGYGNEGDTAPLPMAIAAKPSGGSRVAVLGTDGNVYIGDLDCNDQLVGAPFAIPGENLQDLYADDQGGVVMLTRDALGSGEHHCGGAEVPGGGPGALCGGESSPCLNSFLVRFDNSGAVVWERMITNADEDQDPYSVGARFIWWYQHHGRIVTDGSNYAAYFCIGITTDNNTMNDECIDIHEGDRMQVVDASGNLVDHEDAFEVGCSHSWQTRIVWDPRANKFVMVCATDHLPCGIYQPAPYRMVAEGECNGSLFGGDLVLATSPGYWTAWSQDGQIRLEHFLDGEGSDQTIMAGESAHPKLVSYGAANMLLAWESGASMTAQVRNAGTGDTVGAEFTIGVEDHNFQAFKAFSDGSVAYAAAGSTGTSVAIARVMPCN